EAEQAIGTADAPVRATPREAETPAEPADETEIVVEEPPDESPPAANHSATLNSCPCGPECACENCTCPDHVPDAGKMVSTGRLPRLRVTVWDEGCLRCE